MVTAPRAPDEEPGDIRSVLAYMQHSINASRGVARGEQVSAVSQMARGFVLSWPSFS